MAEPHINLVKLCVGAQTLDDLIAWRARWRANNPDQPMQHITRMRPKRARELLNGGSLYWVIKGVILARQRIVRLDEIEGEDGIRRCGIRMSPEVIRTTPAPRRPFQGWRYLAAEDAPRDLPQRKAAESTLPAELALALAELGLK